MALMMINNNVVVDLTLPKVIGESETLNIPRNATVLDVIKKLNQHMLLDKIIINASEFNQFVLIYLNGQRIKDPSICITRDSKIEIIIPMAGG